MLICSDEIVYTNNISYTAFALGQRAYPQSLLRTVSYDQKWRAEKFRELLTRTPKTKNVHRSNRVFFKIPYLPWGNTLDIKREYKKLLAALRKSQGAVEIPMFRLMIIHVSRNNLFCDTYALNFPDC